MKPTKHTWLLPVLFLLGTLSTQGQMVQQGTPDASEFPKCWPVLKKYFGNIKPAATMISAGLANDEMKIEIEATAVLG